MAKQPQRREWNPLGEHGIPSQSLEERLGAGEGEGSEGEGQEEQEQLEGGDTQPSTEQSSTNPQKGDQSSPILERITQLGQSIEGQNQLLQDPQILEILRAKQEGRQVKIVDDQGQATGQQTPLTDEFKDIESIDDLDPKKLVGALQSQIQSIEQKIDQRLSKELDPLKQKLSQTESYVQEEAGQRLKSQIDAARKKYSDFDQYRGDMVEISKSNPGLGVEELYFVARQRAGQQPIPPTKEQPATTERPTNTTTRPQGTPQADQTGKRPDGVQPKGQKSSRRAFHSALQNALDNVEV